MKKNNEDVKEILKSNKLYMILAIIILILIMYLGYTLIKKNVQGGGGSSEVEMLKNININLNI